MSAAAVPTPGTTVDTVAALLGEHQTTRFIMSGWTDRNGKDSDRHYGWDCTCGAKSPDRFKIDLTFAEVEAGRHAHVAAVLLASGLVVPVAEVERMVDEWEADDRAYVNDVGQHLPSSVARMAEIVRDRLVRLAGRGAGGGS